MDVERLASRPQYVEQRRDMLTNANHQTPDQRTGELQRPDGASSAATPQAILERDHRRIQRLGMAAYRNSSPQRGHQ